jgi:hypothetical protein
LGHAAADASCAKREQEDSPMWYWFGGFLAFIWIVCFIILGVATLRKGHWVFFVLGIFLPLFWAIGALIPPTERAQAAGV